MQNNTPKVDIFSFAMLLFELLAGQRPFKSLTTTEELNRAVAQGERPAVTEGNLNPAFPAMLELMQDCWRHSASERLNAEEVHQVHRPLSDMYIYILFAVTSTTLSSPSHSIL